MFWELIYRWRCFWYGDPAPSICVYIKLKKVQTRTNLGPKPQWKKWHQIQNLLGILMNYSVKQNNSTFTFKRIHKGQFFLHIFIPIFENLVTYPKIRHLESLLVCKKFESKARAKFELNQVQPRLENNTTKFVKDELCCLMYFYLV